MPFIGNKPSAVPLTSADITDNIIVNADINSAAAIAYSKLSLGTSIVNADISTSAAIATTKLGAGAVLQVVTATDSTTRTTTSTSFVTGSNTLSLSITPSSASNKIFIIASVATMNSTLGYNSFYTIFRDSTNIGDASNGFAAQYGVSSIVSGLATLTCLDSPSTTSAITYQVYMKAESPSTARINQNSQKSVITAFEIKG